MQAYLEVYPTGRYVAEARACLEGQLGLDQAERRLVQQGLATLDYSAGVMDGLFGPATRRTIRAWQEAKEFVATGYLTREQADALIALGKEAAVEQATAQQVAREEAARSAREADDAAYTEAQRVNTAAAYGEYMASYPSGRHVQEARAAQQRLGVAAERAGREKVLAQLDAQMVRVPGGIFSMGCTPEQEGCDDSERPVRQVEVSSFELSKYEVTQEVWVAIMGENPSHFQNCPQCPVEQISWDDVQEFCGS